METIAQKLQTAIQKHQAGDLATAEHLYREIINQQPNHADAIHLLGVVALQSGRTEEAVERIARAVELRPGLPTFHSNLASAYRQLENLDQAVDHYRQALEVNPDDAEVRVSLARTLVDQDESDEAASHFRRALESDSNCRQAEEYLDRQYLDQVDSDQHKRQTTTTDDVPSRGSQRTVLHVGSGPPNPENLHERFRTADWKELRLDIDPAVNPDIVASLTDMYAVRSNSVDAVWSSHNLEHLEAHLVPVALREFQRVLKPGGFALITLPDLQQIAEFVIADQLEDVAYEAACGPIRPLDCIFGNAGNIARGQKYMAHRTGFTGKTLTAHLLNAGFPDVETSFAPFAIWAEATKAAAEKQKVA